MTNTEKKNTSRKNRQYESTERPVYGASYDDELNEVYSKLSGREKFSYNPASDGLYQQYKDSYIQQGRRAMQDSIGQAVALTGGYGSSYAESVGQQSYDEQLQKLFDIVPELYGLAYQRYQDEGESLETRYGMLSDLRANEYEEYENALDEYNYAEEQEYQREKDAREEEQQSYQQRRSEAETRAKYGDFSAYEELYGKDTAERLRSYWIASNPEAAYNMGLITAERYYSMTAGLPGSSTSASGTSQGSYYPSTAPDGRDASVVQRELRNMGYNIAVDGAWGPKSQKAWEKAYGSSSSRYGGQSTR